MIEYFKSAAFFETLFLLVIGVVIFGTGNFIDKRYFKSKAGNTKWYKSSRMIIELINTVVSIILILAILSVNGVNVKRYFTSLGILGIIMSFALQDILKDVIMGLSIMFEGYFKVGDLVIFEGAAGKVVSFNIKTTKLFMLDDEQTVSICNRNIGKIGVASDWVDLNIPIGYDVDLYYSRFLCRECAKRIERLRHVYSCDFLNTQELGESWVEYKLRIHCLPEKKPMVKRNAQAVVQDVFYEHNQDFPLSIKVIYNVDEEELKQKNSEKVKLEIQKDNSGMIAPHQVGTKGGHRKKYDYELGRGAAKSKTIALDGSNESIKRAIDEAERYGTSENLGQNMKLKLRLVAEELLTLTKTIPHLENGTFRIERDGNDYDMCFDATGVIDKKVRNKLVGVSTDNTNQAYEGISGLFTKAIDSMIQMSIDDKKGVNKSSQNAMEESIGKSDNNYKWSYNIYKEKEMDFADEEGININEEEIGKSLLMKMSDDIRISVRTNHVNMRVLVKKDDDEKEMY